MTMRLLKILFGVTFALLPVLYCARLVYYFVDGSGSMEDVWAIGLGPTVVGLTVVGALFAIGLAVRIALIFSRSQSQGPRGRSGPDTPTRGGDDQSSVDADAVIARYMAQRSVEAAAAPAAPPADKSAGPTERPSFGRKIR